MTEAAEKPKPLIPSQVKANPGTYLNQSFLIAGYPGVKKDPVTGKWSGTSDGMPVELTNEANTYLEKYRKTRTRPVFKATLVKRNDVLTILYKEGVEPD